VCVCVCVCVCVYVRACVRARLCVCVCACLWMRVRARARACGCRRACVLLCALVCVRACVGVRAACATAPARPCVRVCAHMWAGCTEGQLVDVAAQRQAAEEMLMHELQKLTQQVKPDQAGARSAQAYVPALLGGHAGRRHIGDEGDTGQAGAKPMRSCLCASAQLRLRAHVHTSDRLPMASGRLVGQTKLCAPSSCSRCPKPITCPHTRARARTHARPPLATGHRRCSAPCE
jgi:hypothetical protein